MSTRSLDAEEQLSSIMAERIRRECLFVPSARIGLYLALRHRFSPGNRILIAPTNCETVLFTVLVAGLTPVMAPVSPRNGNIDVPRVDWTGLAGVVSTNLYGLPDDLARLRAECDRRGLTLIDDAAHAMLTHARLTAVEDRPAGTFGAYGLFSLSKHARAMGGGFLAVEDPRELPALRRLRDALLIPGGLRRDVLGALRPSLRETVYATGLVRPLWHLLKATGVIKWTGHRCDPRPGELRKALATRVLTREAHRSELDAFEPWMSVDTGDWRRRPGPRTLAYLRTRFDVVDRERERRLFGSRMLQESHFSAAAVWEDRPQPLLRVPLLVADRDKVVFALERLGVVPGFVYDPPLDDYAGPTLVHPGPTPEVARWWTRHVFPVDPLRAGPTLRLLLDIGARPAPDPPS
ncbi:DegT/DnrJ/EryC1/StrS family aminotransferase [Rhizohabitans arisaemae]|uniref:DegT/DnrJ/EryC1/StrS family aminotransferase n=1 Tax=Rhizohabitans arisaemae TaxID=2720610 RepID=UPI0024B20113|nr:DegT/DnrJ/EryC1/StrS family aminotransferase [Rhizohabitans arisaemae]